MGLWNDALEMLGPSNPFQGSGPFFLCLHRRDLLIQPYDPALSGPTHKSDGGLKVSRVPV